MSSNPPSPPTDSAATIQAPLTAQEQTVASRAPTGNPRSGEAGGSTPGISWLPSTAKNDKNDLASDPRREPRKQKHDPGDEKRDETSGESSRNLVDVARQPELPG